jgi:hypothetical protein
MVSSEERLLAALQAQVAALEASLERRSRILEALIATLDTHQLETLERLEAGLPPLPRGPFAPATWSETTAFRPSHVLPALRALWAATPADRP